MGKKKKSFYKKSLKLVSNNKVFLAALGGIATGISLANILGTEKAKQIVETIENSAKDFANKITSNIHGDKESKNGSAKSYETKMPV